MAQVRLVVLNGEFSPRRILALEIAASHHDKCIEVASLGRHLPKNRTDHTTPAASPCDLTLPNFYTLSSAPRFYLLSRRFSPAPELPGQDARHDKGMHCRNHVEKGVWRLEAERLACVRAQS
ncbi:hypothetical protein B0G76_8433 [Paraburkholderia sp. BL23I1N1]|nr:hypothetical protein B0G76_8433 [Paraburkholderia sp. BL23I1N1]